ncbi:hypothetical protein N8294_02865 [Polaribacter sp.]|nr:hypothetical protein [Polaribacter sp.]
MSYQAVVRDANNTLIANQTIGMQISILQSTIIGTVVYTETHSVDTNINGLVSLEIGNGNSSDNFSEIDWSAGPYFIKTETDPTGGSSYTITGTSQLMSVPFALYATTSGSSQTNSTNITNNTAAIETNTTAIELNTAKIGITTEQSDAITANTAKVGYTEALVSANPDVVANTAKIGITTEQSDAITANTAKVGYTEALVSANPDVVANTAKIGITTEQSDAIVANSSNFTSISFFSDYCRIPGGGMYNIPTFLLDLINSIQGVPVLPQASGALASLGGSAMQVPTSSLNNTNLWTYGAYMAFDGEISAATINYFYTNPTSGGGYSNRILAVNYTSGSRDVIYSLVGPGDQGSADQTFSPSIPFSRGDYIGISIESAGTAADEIVIDGTLYVKFK